MKSRSIIIIVLSVLGLITLNSSVFVVDETEQVVITQFGKPIGDVISTPGIHFKVPFTQRANYFDRRYLEWDGDRAQVSTEEKQLIFVDTYARWQITDPLQFYKRLTNERGAQSRIDDILDGETKDHIAKNKIHELVRSTNRDPIQSSQVDGVLKDSLRPISVGRAKIQDEILASANIQAADLGIEILDFRFKRINYVQDVKNQVYKRMISERDRIADKFRSEGQGVASKINGEKERELNKIQSEAFKVSEEIKGSADAKAAAIYSAAYNRTSQSRELYSFLKSMEMYQQTFDDQTYLILSTESDIYRYLKSMK